jgi:hypothetical protein
VSDITFRSRCPGRETKNLLIGGSKSKQHFLAAVPDEKSVDLKSFGEAPI